MAEIGFLAVSPSGTRRLSLRRDWKPVTIGAVILVDVIWIWLTDFTFEIAGAAKAAALVALLTAVGWFYRARRPDRRFATLCIETAYLLAFSASAAILSYLTTSLRLPLIDDQLLAVEAALGFDWIRYVSIFNGSAWLGALSSAAYATTLSQVALTVVVLGLGGNIHLAGRFVSAVMLGAMVCIVVSAALPAAGALGTLRPSADFLVSQPVVDLAYKQVFFDLRDGLERHISLDHLHGLIAFPSYHCTLSVLIAAAFWRLQPWFWPIAALNGFVILVTPVDGGHHMIDALAGVAVGIASWRIAAALEIAGSRSTNQKASA